MFDKNVDFMVCVKSYPNFDLRPDLDRSRLGDFDGGRQEAQLLGKIAANEEKHSNTSKTKTPKILLLSKTCSFQESAHFHQKQMFIKTILFSSKTHVQENMCLSKHLLCEAQKHAEARWSQCDKIVVSNYVRNCRIDFSIFCGRDNFETKMYSTVLWYLQQIPYGGTGSPCVPAMLCTRTCCSDS